MYTYPSDCLNRQRNEVTAMKFKNIFKRKRKHRIQKAIAAILNQVFIKSIGSYGAFLIDENGHLVDEWDMDEAEAADVSGIE